MEIWFVLYVVDSYHFFVALFQSRKDDKKEAVNYHVKCFFEKQRLQSEGDVDGLEKLRMVDQNRIRGYISKLTRTLIVLVLSITDIAFCCPISPTQYKDSVAEETRQGNAGQRH